MSLYWSVIRIMFFIKQDKVDEDVEKIRNYTLSSEHLKEKLQEEAEFSRKQKEVDEQFTWKDVFAMTIAIIQVILPYMLIMFAVMVLTFLFFYWRAHS